MTFCDSLQFRNVIAYYFQYFSARKFTNCATFSHFFRRTELFFTLTGEKIKLSDTCRIYFPGTIVGNRDSLNQTEI